MKLPNLTDVVKSCYTRVLEKLLKLAYAVKTDNMIRLHMEGKLKNFCNDSSPK
jgi:hypothetical protein